MNDHNESGAFSTVSIASFTNMQRNFQRLNDAQANGGEPSRLQSPRLVAAVAELGSLGALKLTSHGTAHR
jgi:hypothetical protein